MPHTTRKRYAVVSCHVERPLDDRTWARFSELQRTRSGGFAVAALMRPADAAAGEDEDRWLERAQAAAVHGPLGHHTHWTAPDHARPTGGPTGERVLAEGRRLRELGLEPTLFCGGGWYTDANVAQACSELGYVDCTPRAKRPPYLPSGEPWAWLSQPACIRLPSGSRLLALPTTHSLGDLARRSLRRTELTRGRHFYDQPDVVHLYFHDTDLLDGRRRALLRIALRLLAKRAEPIDLTVLAATMAGRAPRITWNDVARL